MNGEIMIIIIKINGKKIKMMMDGEKMLIIMIMINGGIMAIKKMIVGETMKIIIIIKMRTMDGEVVKIIIEIITIIVGEIIITAMEEVGIQKMIIGKIMIMIGEITLIKILRTIKI